MDGRLQFQEKRDSSTDTIFTKIPQKMKRKALFGGFLKARAGVKQGD
jgi:DNA modification methylase